MNANDIDFYLIIKLLLLIGIGMGPKIALVPFLELTQGIDAKTQKKVGTRIVKTAVGTAMILLALSVRERATDGVPGRSRCPSWSNLRYYRESLDRV